LEAAATTTTTTTTTTDNHEIVVMNWECVADTRSYRIPLGMAAALQVWPELKELWDLTTSTDDDDHSWLLNKLLALAHVFSSGGNDEYSATCDYALATRLLLEEQELDNGESNGKNGKYASRFHPRGRSTKTTKSALFSRSSSSSSSTRPLTVGEIAVNWNSVIRETLEVRYHCDYQNPIPILQAAIDELLQEESSSSSSSPSNKYEPPGILSEFPLSGLSMTQKRVLLTVPHRSDWTMAQSSLTNANVNYQAVESIEEALACQATPVLLLLLDHSKSSSSSSSSCTLDILKEAPEDATVTIIESSWDRLQNEIVLFGDYIPRQENKGKCIVPDRFLSLYLADWSATSHLTQQSSATMNPWTNVLSCKGLEELVQPKSFE
jgi:hypothetical protein